MDPDLSWRLQYQVPGIQGRLFALGNSCEGGLAPTQPLVRPAPQSGMVFPLVVLVAVLPCMAALNFLGPDSSRSDVGFAGFCRT